MKWLQIVALTSIILGVLGCGRFVNQATLDSDQITLSHTIYPRDAARGDDLDIYVVRQGGTIDLNNLTAHVYTEMFLWLNQAYVGKVDHIEIGTANSMELSQFINQHGELYPQGAFLQPDKSFPIVLAELFDPATGRRHRLIVRTNPA